ncbi:MAG: sigma-70 family RNA polymerase sigma factor [Planctomycetes bacterium]|nr:sigma-70 family RNA polymerase sigma factor [Planctomycetota bacterium]
MLTLSLLAGPELSLLARSGARGVRAASRPGYTRVMHDDAEKLFADAAAGNGESLEKLLERYLPQLHGFVRARLGAALSPREASVDVVQSICRQVLAAKERFEFRGEERFRAWLFTTALNKLREKHRVHHAAGRSLQREARSLDHDPVTAAAILLTPSAEAIGRETAEAIEASLAALSEEHREVITLARIVQLPHRVIAELMERSEEATRKLLSRAILALGDELESRGIELDRWNRA